jgi:aspartate/methionine/tyrosine aminotransferase
VSEGLDLACRALINPGDKVMYHQPCYVSYSPSITLAFLGETFLPGRNTFNPTPLVRSIKSKFHALIKSCAAS